MSSCVILKFYLTFWYLVFGMWYVQFQQMGSLYQFAHAKFDSLSGLPDINFSVPL